MIEQYEQMLNEYRKEIYRSMSLFMRDNTLDRSNRGEAVPHAALIYDHVYNPEHIPPREVWKASYRMARRRRKEHRDALYKFLHMPGV